MKALNILAAVMIASAIVACSPQSSSTTNAQFPPLAGDWATYAGDYTNQRFSQLTQENRDTVKQLTLAWVTRVDSSTRGAITGGEGSGDFPVSGASIKGAVLEADGMLFATSPDHAWAFDGRDGRPLWHFFWKTRGGTHLPSRGSALWNDTFLFLTPDNYMVALNAHTGEELWHTEIADFNQQFGTAFADDEFDTVGGLVLRAFGRLPKRGEATTMEGLRFRVLRADSRRLHTLQVERIAPPPPSEPAE
jgi:alcohol dehydrogenase (cytochrome c)